MTSTVEWKIGELVQVQPRTWAGINRPGGHGKITQIHTDAATGAVESLDVKYTITGGFDTQLEVDLVSKYQELSRRQRKPRTVMNVGNEPSTKPAKENKTVHGKANKKRKNTQQKPVVSTKCKKQRRILPSKSKKNKVKKLVKTPRTQIHDYGASSDLEGEVPREISVPLVCKISPLPDHKTTGPVHCSPRGNDEDENSPLTSKSRSSLVASSSSGPSSPEEPEPQGCSSSSPPRGTHLTMGQVYQDARQKAASFIDMVVAGRSNDAVNTTSEQPSSPPRPEPSVEEEAACPRQQAFQALLHHLLLMNESMVEQDGLVEQINSLSQERRDDDLQFDPAETQQFVQALAQEGKIMDSDGLIILI